MGFVRFLKNVYITIFSLILRAVYITSRMMTSKDDMKAVFVTSRAGKLEGNLLFVYEELKKQLPYTKIHFVHANNKMNLSMFKEIISLSNTRYLIIDDYYLPIYLIKPSAHLKVIQLWHAAGAFKKFGYSTVGTKFGPDPSYLKRVPVHSNYTHVYVSAEKFIQNYAEAFNMSAANIFPYGLPRIDFFNDTEKKACFKKNVYETYPILGKDDSINILIAPTYRANKKYGESTSEFTQNVLNVISRLNEDILIIFKSHPYTSKKDLSILRDCSNVIIADDYSINEWMVVSDAFVTDYSSAIFEYALLKRPLAHFVPDYEEYSTNRGFYSTIDDISDGAILKDENALIEWLNSRTKNEYFNTLRMIDYNFDYTENISSRIVKHFTMK